MERAHSIQIWSEDRMTENYTEFKAQDIKVRKTSAKCSCAVHCCGWPMDIMHLVKLKFSEFTIGTIWTMQHRLITLTYNFAQNSFISNLNSVKAVVTKMHQRNTVSVIYCFSRGLWPPGCFVDQARDSPIRSSPDHCSLYRPQHLSLCLWFMKLHLFLQHLFRTRTMCELSSHV